MSSYQKINDSNGNFTGILDNEDLFGIAVDNIGDLDGNGVNDLIVGAPNDDDGGTNRGAVWILFLDADNQVISHTKISSTTGNFTGALDNEDRFGGGVAFLGDMNGDGLIEVSVTSDYDGDGGFWHGAFYILSLNNDGTVNSHQKISDLEGGFTGNIFNDAIFGTDVENIGDLNGDGIDDLVAGSRRDADGGSRRGAVWILFMNADFTVNSFQKISDTQGNFTPALAFEDFFGGSVANLGDLDGDDVTDIAVGSYRDDDLISNSGSFYVLFLNTDGTVKSHQKVSNLFGNLATELTIDALFGESIDGVLDMDSDGRIEILVGALRQRNPSLSTQTGAFFLVELNADGTVSEEYIYTYGENCFSGDLNSGDFFGGAVSILDDTAGQESFAVGAYRDSENGVRRGAVWILDLGEVNYQIQHTDASRCDMPDGTITVSDLTPNVNYNITYTYDGNPFDINVTSSASGTITLTDLAFGNYENIVVTEIATGCQDDLGQIFINQGDFSLNYTEIDPSSCGFSDGQILISNLAANVEYVVDYFYNSTQFNNIYTADVNGEILLTGLSAGDYTNMMVLAVDFGCSGGRGLLQLEDPGLNATVDSTNSTSCILDNGVITFSGLNPNSNHTIVYDYNGIGSTVNTTSGATGNLILNNLSSGNYTNIIITEDASGCSSNLGDLFINAVDFILNFSETDPSACGISDGEILISDLEPNQNYDVSYLLNSVLIQNNYTSNASGEILLSALSAGQYENITVVSASSGCSDIEPLLELEGAELVASIASSNPTSCTLENGSISFSNLSSNTGYSITFDYNGTPSPTLILVSDSSGVLTIDNLSSGSYENIVITENGSGCQDTLGTILIEPFSFDPSFSKTDPSCGLDDGSIIISNLTSNTSYNIEYLYDSQTIQNTLTSNSSGQIILSNLSIGQYENIFVLDLSSSCSETTPLLELEGTEFNASITATNTTSCDLSDGSITITGLQANADYTINLDFNGSPSVSNLQSGSDGTIVVTGLSLGNYMNIIITEDATGCVDMLGNLSIICQTVVNECFTTRDFFTPNNDGFNDEWQLDMINPCEYTLNIHDRYGKILAILNPSDPSWNGMYNGTLMPKTDYWFKVEYTTLDNITRIYRGHFSLLR